MGRNRGNPVWDATQPHSPDREIREMIMDTPSDIIAAALRAANTNRVVNTAAHIADLYCEVIADGSLTCRYIHLTDGEALAYFSDHPSAVHCPVYDGTEPQCAADDDDMIEASYGLLADLIAEQGGMLCLPSGTELRHATAEEMAESWIVGGSGMIETTHAGHTVIAYVEAAQ